MLINTFQIIAIIIFVISSSIANIGFKAKYRTPRSLLPLMLMDKTFVDLFYLPASLLFIASTIYLLMSSWFLFLIVAIATAILTLPVINPFVMRFMLSPIYTKLLKRAEK